MMEQSERKTDGQVYIEGKKIFLRPIDDGDTERIVAWRNRRRYGKILFIRSLYKGRP